MTDFSPPHFLPPGSRVGPWLVESYASHGTYGLVYKASRADSPGSAPVALKLARFPQDLRFVREAHLLSIVKHPSVPALLGQGWWLCEASGSLHPFIAMEWIHGLNLYDWAQAHSPSSRQLLRVLAQLSGALAALHRVSGLHRDVKGHNILVQPCGRAVLMDFGSGTWAGAPPLTERIQAPGTPGYRSPEALLFRSLHEGHHEARYHASAADDLYALGVSLYRLVAGLYPPPETAPGSPVDPYRAPAPPRRALRELNPLLEPWLAALIERLLSKEPSQRGFALEHERAALAVAQHAGPEADAPLVEAQEMSKEAVPEQAPAPVASPAELAAASARAWTAPGAQVGLFAAILALIGGAILLSPRLAPPAAPQVVEVEQQDGGSEPDGGTRGLGDGTATTRAEEYGVLAEAGSKALALQMPDGPLDGQMRPPCRGKDSISINGGCWIELKTMPPHCGHDEYEWKNGCYYPFMEHNGHPRTSKDPQ